MQKNPGLPKAPLPQRTFKNCLTKSLFQLQIVEQGACRHTPRVGSARVALAAATASGAEEMGVGVGPGNARSTEVIAPLQEISVTSKL